MKKKHKQAAIDRLGRLKALQKELAEIAGLGDVDRLGPEDKVRIDSACWILMARRSVEAALLAGRAEPEHVVYLERLSAALSQLMPKPKSIVEIKWTESVADHCCPKCGDPMPDYVPAVPRERSYGEMKQLGLERASRPRVVEQKPEVNQQIAPANMTVDAPKNSPPTGRIRPAYI